MTIKSMRRSGTTTRRNSRSYRTTTGKTRRGSWGGSRGSTGGSYNRGKSTGHTTVSGVAPGYQQVSNNLYNKARSYRTLWQHTKGSGSQTRPTTTTFKTFANWVNKGANVWYVTNKQINHWCKTNHKFTSGSAAKNALCKRFGKSAIKAVSCSKNGFLVAAAPTIQGRKFEFPR